jgi:hypothetical protein
MARPKIYPNGSDQELVALKMPPKMKRALQELASQDLTSVSSVARRALLRELKERGFSISEMSSA